MTVNAVRALLEKYLYEMTKTMYMLQWMEEHLISSFEIYAEIVNIKSGKSSYSSHPCLHEIRVDDGDEDVSPSFCFVLQEMSRLLPKRKKTFMKMFESSSARFCSNGYKFFLSEKWVAE
jgi:hypothetical protein